MLLLWIINFKMNNMKTSTWYHELKRVLAETGDSFDDLTIHCKRLHAPISAQHGRSIAPEFFAWSENFVYFGAEYDGWDYLNYVSRNPVQNPKKGC